MLFGWLNEHGNGTFGDFGGFRGDTSVDTKTFVVAVWDELSQ